jgi:hypothetical protein
MTSLLFRPTNTAAGAKLPRVFGLQGDSWMRHANPASVWTRFTVLPLLALSIWSRAWLGWWCLLPVALSIAWMLLNPRVFLGRDRRRAGLRRRFSASGSGTCGGFREPRAGSARDEPLAVLAKRMGSVRGHCGAASDRPPPYHALRSAIVRNRWHGFGLLEPFLGRVHLPAVATDCDR